ncbi:MAG: metal-sensing transcriptional repressor [Alphaproteobacteria bacterium]
MSKHHSHPDILNRLKRANGHLAKIVSMIEAEAPCVEVAQQLQAVESAISNAKRTFVQDHIEHCLDDVATQKGKHAKEALKEFKEITKYL